MISFSDGDTVIDCGANIGELNISFKEKGLNLNYIAFEPDKEIFDCLKYNNPEENCTLYNLGLSDKNTTQDFFIDSTGGNSSFVNFGVSEFKQVKVSRLDSIATNNKIKLLKIDAEGYEPEVLDGTEGIYEKIEYVSVDFGCLKCGAVDNSRASWRGRFKKKQRNLAPTTKTIFAGSCFYTVKTKAG